MSASRSGNSSEPRPDHAYGHGIEPRTESGEVKVAVLGGSSAFTPALAEGLARAARDLPALEIRLHGRSEERLAWVTRFCNRYARSRSIPHEYTWTVSVREAAEDARIVVNQMRIGGWAGRSHDELFPLEFGIPGDETIGPGGLASALRAVPVVLDAARKAAAVAPGAWFVNMGNPMGILLAGLHGIPGLRPIGLCELPAKTLEHACGLVGADAGRVQADYLGLNHQGWFVRLFDGGRDLLPGLFEKIGDPAEAAFFKVESRVMKKLGALPLSYMRIYYHGAREVERIRTRQRSRGQELQDLSARLYDCYRDVGEAKLPGELRERDLSWFELALVPALKALLGGGEELLYVSERNDGAIPGLPESSVVEKRCYLDEQGTRMIPFTGPGPEEGGPLESFLRFLRRVARFEEAGLAAALEPDRERIAEALRLHPLEIDGAKADAMAVKIMESMDSLNA
jgi:6-phospho-beta-glucosidase